MRVIISVPGRFWAFDLARELMKRNALFKLMTGYPRRRAENFSLPPDRVVSLPLVQAIWRGWSRLPAPLRNLHDPSFAASEIFDRQASRRLEECDIFTGWSGFSLHSLHRAENSARVRLLERGSTHIRYQQKILKEEYERSGCRGPLAHPAIIEKELAEYAETDYIVVPSQFVVRSFLAEGIEAGKLIHNPFGVDLRGFRPAPKKDSVFRIIMVGGLSLRKGVHYLLRAFDELRLKNSELLLIGRPAPEIIPYMKKYRGAFTWISSLKQSELPRHYSQASVFVLPSIEEGLALVQIQAMACGLPLICTPNTGAEDLIENGKHGFIIPVRDSEALKEKLEYLYRNPETRQRMGAAAAVRAREAFSWDDYGQRTWDNYRRVLAVKENK